MVPESIFLMFPLKHLNCLTLNKNVQVLGSSVSANGHIMGGQIWPCLRYTPFVGFDENMLHSVTLSVDPTRQF